MRCCLVLALVLVLVLAIILALVLALALAREVGSSSFVLCCLYSGARAAGMDGLCAVVTVCC